MKAIVDADSGQILGQLTYTAMADAIFTHPLFAEGLNTLFALFDA